MNRSRFLFSFKNKPERLLLNVALLQRFLCWYGKNWLEFVHLSLKQYMLYERNDALKKFLKNVYLWSAWHFTADPASNVLLLLIKLVAFFILYILNNISPGASNTYCELFFQHYCQIHSVE